MKSKACTKVQAFFLSGIGSFVDIGTKAAQSESLRPTVRTERSLQGITKRGAYWWVQVRCKGYPPQAHTFDTKSKAQAWARIVERDTDSGALDIPDESDHTTLVEALERYWDDIASKKRQPSQ